VLEGCDQVVRIPMEGSVASLNAAAAGTVLLYEALRQRRRNVPPADTRTPAPAKPVAVTPQEEDMDILDEADEAELEADLAEDESENGEPAATETVSAPDGEPADSDAADDDEARASAPKKPAARAKKTTAPKKAAPRKKPAD